MINVISKTHITQKMTYRSAFVPPLLQEFLNPYFPGTVEVTLLKCVFFLFSTASSSVAGAVGMTTSGESESDDSEMGRLQGNVFLYY